MCMCVFIFLSTFCAVLFLALIRKKVSKNYVKLHFSRIDFCEVYEYKSKLKYYTHLNVMKTFEKKS